MKKLTKRQQKRIDYFLREKQSRKEKQEFIHNTELPKFVEKHFATDQAVSIGAVAFLYYQDFFTFQNSFVPCRIGENHHPFFIKPFHDYLFFP